jgi:uncharacterized membrane protein YidH (DUF202 family)
VKEFLQRFATLGVALLGGLTVAMFVGFLGLFVGEVISILGPRDRSELSIRGTFTPTVFIGTITAIIGGALGTAIGAYAWVGNRLASDRALRRLLPILVVSGATAVIVALALLVLMFFGPIPGTLLGPLFVFIGGMVFIAWGASGAAWHFFTGSTGGGLGREAVMQVGLLGLVSVLLYGLYSVLSAASSQ